MDEIKGESEFAQRNDLIASNSSDEWESDEENDKEIKYQPLPQDAIENGESSDVDLNDDNTDIDEVY